MSNSPPRSRGALLRPGFLQLCFTDPERGVGGAPRNVRVLGGTPVRRAHNAARQAPSEALCVPCRGTLASRRSTVAVLGSGAALLSPALLPDRLQRAPRSQVVVPGGRLPCLPRRAVTSRRRGTPRLA